MAITPATAPLSVVSGETRLAAMSEASGTTRAGWRAGRLEPDVSAIAISRSISARAWATSTPGLSRATTIRSRGREPRARR
jgi:hypothetical protein